MEPQEVVDLVRRVLGDMVRDVKIWKGNDYIEVEIDASSIREAAARMKEAGFDHVKDVTAVDYMKEGRFRIIYNLSSYNNFDLSYYIVGLAYDIPRDKPETVSLADIYTSAEFQEREVYEGFGIIFKGHPDLKPLLLSPPVAEQKPLRKDFIVREEPEIKVEKKR
ncbi:MAG: NADH-quinone oxidoreductase subunit C [Desulfurococcales archaeon]|nr:NADH-quinone oxidoreductase subunit C [Desulfurococcales archaeon]